MSKIGPLSQKSLFYLFLMTSTLLMMSMLLVVLRPNGRISSLDLRLFPRANENLVVRSSSVEISNEEEEDQLGLRDCEILKVFMYDLPPQFHFALLGWKGGGNGASVWPDVRASEVPEYPGGLNLQHSVEYWLTLDLLSSEFERNLSGRSAVRVHDPRLADVVFVPFFASISYNKFSKVKVGQRSVDDLLQEKLVRFLTSREEWKRSGGKDHIIVAHHPNSLLSSRMKLWPATYVLADFGRYPLSVANVEKDVIAPYVHLAQNYLDDRSDFDSRPTLLYFQGAIYRKAGGTIRQELYYMLQDEKDVHFAFGSIKGDGISNASLGMQQSKFCLNIAGDTPSSNRLFDAIASHCVPVIISDEIELPYEDILDYSEFSVFVSREDALKENFLITMIRNIGREEWTKMWRRLKEVEQFFEFRYPSRPNDAVQMIWQAIARRVPAVTRKVNRASRFSETAESSGETWLWSAPLPRNFT
ncbi:probable arabinosyltransferase ARAD1 [Andrographis paniculata]|uniref:probable arabinosyltransferase ARAD1 n=1 Tax=Andrographis paniculata TaxID=175694 RepID=UPI0021E8EE2E|nr:probable arabinosyltransferase ARAD1 [Andrographis paniculata]